MSLDSLQKTCDWGSRLWKSEKYGALPLRSFTLQTTISQHIYLCYRTQQHQAIGDQINLDIQPSSPLFLFISAFPTLMTWGQMWRKDQIQHNYRTGLPFSPSPAHLPLHPPSLLPLSRSVSVSGAPWRHVKCAQLSVMGWEFITFTLRPFMRSHPGEVCVPERSAAQ